MQTTVINVPSITCSICSGKIKDGLMSMNGVKDVNVDLSTQNVDVKYEPSDVDPEKIKKKVMELGYEVI